MQTGFVTPQFKKITPPRLQSSTARISSITIESLWYKPHITHARRALLQYSASFHASKPPLELCVGEMQDISANHIVGGNEFLLSNM